MKKTYADLTDDQLADLLSTSNGIPNKPKVRIYRDTPDTITVDSGDWGIKLDIPTGSMVTVQYFQGAWIGVATRHLFPFFRKCVEFGLTY